MRPRNRSFGFPSTHDASTSLAGAAAELTGGNAALSTVLLNEQPSPLIEATQNALSANLPSDVLYLDSFVSVGHERIEFTHEAVKAELAPLLIRAGKLLENSFENIVKAAGKAQIS